MTVGIVGLGMIGGSVGLALRDPSRQILGFDTSISNAQVAVERQCVDRIVEFEDVAGCQLVFVAVPPIAARDALDRLAACRGDETIVTDCTSVKSDVVAWAEARGASWFVGGHPMAGHEKSGPAYASAWMFRNARWILTPTRTTSRSATKRVQEAIKLMGATVVTCDAGEHDRQIAILSHLPHAFAAILVRLGELIPSTDVAGGSWRDLTRVGGVDPVLWSQILLGNRHEVVRVLAESELMLAELREALSEDDRDRVTRFLAQARAAKQKQEK